MVIIFTAKPVGMGGLFWDPAPGRPNPPTGTGATNITPTSPRKHPGSTHAADPAGAGQDHRGAAHVANRREPHRGTRKAGPHPVSRMRPRRRSGAKGTRTPDPHTASVVRYQLRHSPVLNCTASKTPVATG